MKVTFLSALCTSLLLAVSLVQSRRYDVCVFNSENYSGIPGCLKLGETIDFCDSSTGGCTDDMNDKIHSVYFTKEALDKSMILRVYETNSKQGRFMDISRSTASLKDINNLFKTHGGGISSIQLLPSTTVSPEVCLFRARNYKSEPLCFSKGQKNERLKTGWGDNIQSIHFKKQSDLVLRLYEHPDYRGRHVDITTDNDNMDYVNNNYFNIRVSSLVVHPKTVDRYDICFFQDKNFMSVGSCMKNGETKDLTTSSLSNWNNKVNSVYFDKSARDQKLILRVYEREGSKGRHSLISSTSGNLDAVLKEFDYYQGGISTLELHNNGLPSYDVCVFKSTSYNSQSICMKLNEVVDLCNGKYAGCSGGWDNRIKSVHLRNSNVKLQAFAGSSSGGYYEYIKSSTINTDTSHRPISSSATTLKVLQKNAQEYTICLFSGYNYTGKRECFRTNQKVNSMMSNPVSSYFTMDSPKHWYLRIWYSNNYAGHYNEVTGSLSNLPSVYFSFSGAKSLQVLYDGDCAKNSKNCKNEMDRYLGKEIYFKTAYKKYISAPAGDGAKLTQSTTAGKSETFRLMKFKNGFPYATYGIMTSHGTNWKRSGDKQWDRIICSKYIEAFRIFGFDKYPYIRINTYSNWAVQANPNNNQVHNNYFSGGWEWFIIVEK